MTVVCCSRDWRLKGLFLYQYVDHKNSLYIFFDV